VRGRHFSHSLTRLIATRCLVICISIFAVRNNFPFHDNLVRKLGPSLFLSHSAAIFKMTLYELQPKKSENISDFFDYIYESLKNKFNNEELASQMAVEFAKLRETAINCKRTLYSPSLA